MGGGRGGGGGGEEKGSRSVCRHVMECVRLALQTSSTSPADENAMILQEAEAQLARDPGAVLR